MYLTSRTTTSVYVRAWRAYLSLLSNPLPRRPLAEPPGQSLRHAVRLRKPGRLLQDEGHRRLLHATRTIRNK